MQKLIWKHFESALDLKLVVTGISLRANSYLEDSFQIIILMQLSLNKSWLLSIIITVYLQTLQTELTTRR